ncbi:alpha/beta fold hydrolase [Roseibium sp. RKSG952]|uniref:alpha/beta fold hydrolase n=1 Tax=Roseibium sp. RKSG952 TaxID=2529384 RepID=UPI001FCC69F6|nr:alpha/beta hydrolase [Roseibium sp. RKSG952]
MTGIGQDVRQYGGKTSRVVVLHGGPGGAGEIEPLARELGKRGHSVLEPFKTRHSADGQVDELTAQIEAHCSPPVTLIGWSWGAWLGCLFSARYRTLVHNLILLGSGPFEARFASAIRTTKNSRLTNKQRSELNMLGASEGNIKDVARFIELSDLADTYARDSSSPPTVVFDGEIHAAVWREADEMRTNGSLLEAIATIQCPVLAIHGDYDPRPSEGVQIPLLTALPWAKFVELERCGHKPWQEIHAKEEFYRLIDNAII